MMNKITLVLTFLGVVAAYLALPQIQAILFEEEKKEEKRIASINDANLDVSSYRVSFSIAFRSILEEEIQIKVYIETPNQNDLEVDLIALEGSSFFEHSVNSEYILPKGKYILNAIVGGVKYREIFIFE